MQNIFIGVAMVGVCLLAVGILTMPFAAVAYFWVGADETAGTALRIGLGGLLAGMPLLIIGGMGAECFEGID